MTNPDSISDAEITKATAVLLELETWLASEGFDILAKAIPEVAHILRSLSQERTARADWVTPYWREEAIRQETRTIAAEAQVTALKERVREGEGLLRATKDRGSIFDYAGWMLERDAFLNGSRADETDDEDAQDQWIGKPLV